MPRIRNRQHLRKWPPIFDVHQPNDHVSARATEPDYHRVFRGGILIEFQRRYRDSAPETAIADHYGAPRW